MVCSGNYNTGYQLVDIRIRKGCEDIFDSTSDVTDDLFEILQRPIVRNNVKSVVDKLTNITREPKVLKSRDVVHLSIILSEVSKVDNIPSGVGEGFIDTVNNVLSIDEAQIRIAQTGDHSANRIIKSVERFTERQEINHSGEEKLVRPHIAMTSLRLKDAVNLVVGYASTTLNNMLSQLSPASVSNIYNTSDFSVSNKSAAIILPESLVRRQIRASGEIKLAFVIFQDGRLFRAAGGKNYESKVPGILNSFIVSAKIDGRRIQGLTEKIETVFLPINESADENSTICAYWDIGWDEGNGGWSTEGCSFLKKDDGRIVCACDHLTYFAVLLDFYGQDEPHEEIHVTVLEYTTIIGFSLSIAGLGVTILSFILFKALRRGRGQQTLFCLSSSLLCTYIVFLAGINRTENYGGCIAVAVLLHYFLLASFMWMLMEAVLQYLRFVKVLGTYVPKYMIKSSIPAWGVPLIPVIVVLAIDYDLYKGGDNYCWMSLTALYYAFLVPVGVIIVVNAVLYFIITFKLCCQRNDGLRSNQSKRKANILRAQAGLACVLLMGLTWAFGYLAIEEGRLAFTYLFTILNSLQGFFIFVMFTLREKKVREYWKKLCCKCRRTKEKGQNYRSTTPTSKETNDHQVNTNSTTENTQSTSVSFFNKAYVDNNN